MASAAPPVSYPNVYGIDMPTKEELIAAGRTLEEIREFIGADALIYQDVDSDEALSSARSIPSSTASRHPAPTAATSRRRQRGDFSDRGAARLQFDDEERATRRVRCRA
jgi:amidophosphoribosyltransferase